MTITIKTIPHDSQRYPTVGDWIIHPDHNVDILVSSMDNWKYELLVGFHEMIELVLCKERGITQEAVDKFDIRFEEERAQGMHGLDEPGDDPNAPYCKEHFFATNLERLLAAELKVDWNDYSNVVNNL